MTRLAIDVWWLAMQGLGTMKQMEYSHDKSYISI